jgi:hypothetical protein
MTSVRLWIPIPVAALLFALGTNTSPIAAQSVIQTDWRFYGDAAPDGAMVPLAALNAPAALGSTFLQNGSIRLRVLLAEPHGNDLSSQIVKLQYSADQVTWTDIASQSSRTGEPFLCVDGAATNGSLLGSLLLPAAILSAITTRRARGSSSSRPSKPVWRWTSPSSAIGPRPARGTSA